LNSMSNVKWEEGKEYDLGEKQFSASEIIDYAKKNDPLDFHLSEKAANESRFKGLVTSGGQAFNYFYVNAWIPLLVKRLKRD
jgi:acyl dehydratase